MKIKLALLLSTIIVIVSSCTVVRQGEVGVKRKIGKLNQSIIQPGPVVINPFITRVIKMPITTENIEITSNLPSKEGLNVAAIISILYRIQPEKAPAILENIGVNYEEIVITSVFRSAAADVCSRFFAKDMHSSERSVIEKAITEQMTKLLTPRGFDVQAVLLKNIQLPPGLARAVEEKLEAEQDAQRMEFLLDREKKEAQRKMIEAQGIRDAQKVISEGLNDQIIKWQSIEAFKQLSQSPNAKVIMTNGQASMLIGEGEQ
ncbi:prohibitin family protein [Chryseolinea sp. H1M3-3]|uniref:prohibitin family protein n=1 Tax=Chryseolinea sp. H1M3-3 TaxID=3034144 RepID=UPI0023EB5D32|nr:prohibitin family protein [Chryseolinea sp. H1M3-3]